jgi:hypothetical protein
VQKLISNLTECSGFDDVALNDVRPQVCQKLLTFERLFNPVIFAQPVASCEVSTEQKNKSTVYRSKIILHFTEKNLG